MVEYNNKKADSDSSSGTEVVEGFRGGRRGGGRRGGGRRGGGRRGGGRRGGGRRGGGRRGGIRRSGRRGWTRHGRGRPGRHRRGRRGRRWRGRGCIGGRCRGGIDYIGYDNYYYPYAFFDYPFLDYSWAPWNWGTTYDSPLLADQTVLTNQNKPVVDESDIISYKLGYLQGKKDEAEDSETFGPSNRRISGLTGSAIGLAFILGVLYLIMNRRR